MDSKLRDRLIRISKQIDSLTIAEEAFLNLKVSRDPSFALLYLKTEGSVRERECEVHRTTEWRAFLQALVTAEVGYQKEKRLLDLQFKALDCEYLSLKIDTQAIQKHKGIT